MFNFTKTIAMHKNALIILTKNPELGKVKTRIAATLGDSKALEIYKNLLLHTRQISVNLSVDKFVFYSDKIVLNDVWQNNLFTKELQNGTDLGEKMIAAFETVFSQNYASVCIIGSDCYELNSSIIDDAFKLLQTKDCVIGPTFDGGYYLLGTNKLHYTLFQNIEFSTETVCDETVKICKSLNLSTAFTTKLHDVDTESEVPKSWL